MTPFVLPGILDFSADQLTLTPGSYSQLVADTAGTDSVETDPTLGQADDAQVLTEGMGDDPFGAQDALMSLGAVKSAITVNPGQTIGGTIGPAIKSAGGHLNDYEAIVGPVINPTAPTSPPVDNGPTGGTPAAAPCPVGPNLQVLPTMTVGDPVSSTYITDDTSEAEYYGDLYLNFDCADGAIWSITHETKSEGYGSGGQLHNEYFYINVTPAKPGTFNCTVRINFKDGTPAQLQSFSVTINPKPAS